mmetsp:Transcript_73915/g.163352  ORF Transcript_73915/g.163352 Transcript_73915/m.163352 type:complete len:212 (+) Transcript_73915:243-878(+)
MTCKSWRSLCSSGRVSLVPSPLHIGSSLSAAAVAHRAVRLVPSKWTPSSTSTGRPAKLRSLSRQFCLMSDCSSARRMALPSQTAVSGRHTRRQLSPLGIAHLLASSWTRYCGSRAALSRTWELASTTRLPCFVPTMQSTGKVFASSRTSNSAPKPRLFIRSLVGSKSFSSSRLNTIVRARTLSIAVARLWANCQHEASRRTSTTLPPCPTP